MKNILLIGSLLTGCATVSEVKDTVVHVENPENHPKCPKTKFSSSNGAAFDKETDIIVIRTATTVCKQRYNKPCLAELYKNDTYDYKAKCGDIEK